MSQTTEPGTSVPVGSSVAYVVSLGVEQVAVPDLVGRSAAEAETALTELRLVGAPSEAYNAGVPAGDVVSQTTEPGTSVPVGAASPTSSAWASSSRRARPRGPLGRRGRDGAHRARLVGAPSEAYTPTCPPVTS